MDVGHQNLELRHRHLGHRLQNLDARRLQRLRHRNLDAKRHRHQRDDLDRPDAHLGHRHQRDVGHPDARLGVHR
jgi:hypothetical protein